MPISQGYEVNERQNATLTATLFKRSEIVNSINAANGLTEKGRDLTSRSWAALAGAKTFFQNVDGNLRRLSKGGEDLTAKEIGLSGVVEDYRSRDEDVSPGVEGNEATAQLTARSGCCFVSVRFLCDILNMNG